MRAAIYARYSSDRQHERSIDDQVALCEKHLASLGGGSAEVYADYAISGAHLASRPSASRMLEDAAEGKFDIVIAEALDRLSRDQEHIAAIYKQLTFAGVKLITVSEGVPPRSCGEDQARADRPGESRQGAWWQSLRL